MRTLAVLAVTVLLAAAPAARAEKPIPPTETPETHATRASRALTIGDDRIQPPNLEMSPDETFAVRNDTDHPVRVEFLAPSDARERIRCDLLRSTGPSSVRGGTGLFFAWRGGRMSAVIPAKRATDFCRLDRGTYRIGVAAVEARGTPTSGARAPAAQATIEVK
jgi:hypothetical protein